ncbi:hypothetical protein [Dyella ginsengisoli]|uniref:hypothetical protein n=1 Tax=Dyella ginsengisoli TaxID=363848 RepID=UPI0012FD1976|nr:hypothetical protein [Dyella ginsengisoli]
MNIRNALIAILLSVASAPASSQVWRIAQFLAQGPFFGIVYGKEEYCKINYVVVIKEPKMTHTNMWDAVEDPAYKDFQKAEAWIRKTYPDKVKGLRLLQLSFGRPIDSEFPNEEAVFADMFRANFGAIAPDCDETINVKKSGKSFGSDGS